MALFGGAFFTPIIVGVITHTLGWSWSFYFISIFAGAMLPLIFFFVPETAFRRDERFNTDVTGEKTPSGSETPLNRPEDSQSSSPGLKEFAHGNGQQGFIPKKKSYARTLLPFDGWKTDESLIKILFRPLPLFFHPAIAWACLIQGALIGWTVLIGVVLAAIFLGPPLWFDEVKTGYMYAGPFIGAVLGFILSGLMTDFLTRYMIRKNNGVYEPEFRILLVIPQLVIGGIGLFGFGWAAANVQPDGWFLPDFFFALEVMGMVIGAVASALYIVDAHRKSKPGILYRSSHANYAVGEYAIEAFTCMLIFKNVFSFGLTYAAYDWLIEAGIWKIFVIIASIQVGICLLSVPMCESSI